jgi:uncharacterized protein YlxW (UPF0749 family)
MILQRFLYVSLVLGSGCIIAAANLSDSAAYQAAFASKKEGTEVFLIESQIDDDVWKTWLEALIQSSKDVSGDDKKKGIIIQRSNAQLKPYINQLAQLLKGQIKFRKVSTNLPNTKEVIDKIDTISKEIDQSFNTLKGLAIPVSSPLMSPYTAVQNSYVRLQKEVKIVLDILNASLQNNQKLQGMGLAQKHTEFFSKENLTKDAISDADFATWENALQNAVATSPDIASSHLILNENQNLKKAINTLHDLRSDASKNTKTIQAIIKSLGDSIKKLDKLNLKAGTEIFNARLYLVVTFEKLVKDAKKIIS